MGIHRLTIHLGTRMNLNYQLAASRYGVSQDAIIQAAPLCFSILAELSLKRRRDAVARFGGATADSWGFDHLPLVAQGLFRLEEAARLESASIDACDLDGRLADPDGEVDTEGPFSAFLRDMMEDTGIPDTDAIGNAAYVSPTRYTLFAKSLDNIAGDSWRAEFALTERYATVQQIPSDLRRIATETGEVALRRIAWLEGRVPEAAWKEEEARYATLMAGVDIDDLLAGL